MMNWASAGKPDFAQCAAIVSRFDPELRERLNRSEGKVLQWFIFYVWKNCQQSGKNQNYASFSQTTVGGKFGRSRWTVARALDKLSAFGLVRGINRRPTADGKWTTNLYFLGDKLKAILSRLFAKGAPTDRVAKLPHKNADHTSKAGGLPLLRSAASQDKEDPDDDPARDERIREIIRRAKALGAGSGVASRPHAHC
jgi:hypothetical protein